MAQQPAAIEALREFFESHRGVAYEGDAWRVVRDGQDALSGHPAGARWDPGTFDVLYTSLAPEGALEEIYAHLSRRRVFPPRQRFVLYRLSVRTRRTLDLSSLADNDLLNHDHDRRIGAMAAAHGFDGIMAKSARWNCCNLVLFTDRCAPEDRRLMGSRPVDWQAWRELRAKLQGRQEGT